MTKEIDKDFKDKTKFVFLLQMSFSGRLGSSSSANGGCSDSVVPLSISSTSSWDLLWQPDSSSPSAISTTATTSTPVKPVDNIRRPRPTCQAGLAEELVR